MNCLKHPVQMAGWEGVSRIIFPGALTTTVTPLRSRDWWLLCNAGRQETASQWNKMN